MPAQAAAEEELTKAELNDLAKKASLALFGPPPEKTPEEKAKAEADIKKKAEEAQKAKDAEEKKKADEEKAKKEAEEKAAAEAKAAEAAAAAKAAQATPPPQQQAQPTAEDIAAKVAEKIAPKREAAQEPQLSEEDRSTREVFEALERENPKEYKGLVKNFDSFVKAEADYRAQWEKANPGKLYAPDDEEHKEFYDKNEIIYAQEDFIVAKAGLRAEKRSLEINQQKEEERTRNEAAASASKILHDVPVNSAIELARATDPELAKVDLRKKKLEEADPFVEAAIQPYVPLLSAMTGELVKAFTPGLNYRFSEENPLQRTIMLATNRFEQELLALPPEQQVTDDGRKLAPIDKWNKMSAAERQRHWTIWMEPNAVRALLTRDLSNLARQKLEVLRKAAGKSVTAPAKETPPKAAEKKVETPAKAKPSEEFPNTAGGAEGGGSGAGDTVFDKEDPKRITHSLFGS